MKYLKQFDNEAAYISYKDGSAFITPNVSWVKAEDIVFYNPYIVETKLVCTYNARSTTRAIKLCYGVTVFTSMEIDGVMMDSVKSEYTFNTLGEHTVKFELRDITKIGNRAFSSCHDLTSVVIPNSVTSINEFAFTSCSRLTSVVIPNSVTTIGEHAFSKCSKLTGELVIPDSVTSIDGYAFSECSGLTSVHIGSSVTSIGESAFSQCHSLTSVVIPNSVTKIGNYAFVGCTGLTSIAVEEGNTVYDSRENCNCIIKTSTNTLIQGCKNSFIPNSVTTIGEYAFSDCSGLTGELVIPDSVTYIDGQAFRDCTGLTSVHIGSSVTSIGNYVFADCSGLTSITCLAPTAPTINSNTFLNIKSGGVLKVPVGSDYNSWMSTSNYYLGKYNWTIEYI